MVYAMVCCVLITYDTVHALHLQYPIEESRSRWYVPPGSLITARGINFSCNCFVMPQGAVDGGGGVSYNGGMHEQVKQEEQEVAEEQEQKSCDFDPTATQQESSGEQRDVDHTDPAEVQEATDELGKWRDLAMRTAAEYDNYRKRCVKERDEFTRYATRGLLEELLPIVDNFEMGMQMAEAEKGSMIYVGMEMVRKQLVDFMAAQGVEKIETRVGDAFDHNIHEAIQSEPSEQEEGSIVRIVRPGYRLKGKLLRAVNVVTAAPRIEQEQK